MKITLNTNSLGHSVVYQNVTLVALLDGFRRMWLHKFSGRHWFKKKKKKFHFIYFCFEWEGESTVRSRFIYFSKGCPCLLLKDINPVKLYWPDWPVRQHTDMRQTQGIIQSICSFDYSLNAFSLFIVICWFIDSSRPACFLSFTE